LCGSSGGRRGFEGRRFPLSVRNRGLELGCIACFVAGELEWRGASLAHLGYAGAQLVSPPRTFPVWRSPEGTGRASATDVIGNMDRTPSNPRDAELLRRIRASADRGERDAQERRDESLEQQVLPSENAGLKKAQLNQVLQAMQVTQARPRDIRLATFSPKDVSETDEWLFACKRAIVKSHKAGGRQVARVLDQAIDEQDESIVENAEFMNEAMEVNENLFDAAFEALVKEKALKKTIRQEVKEGNGVHALLKMIRKLTVNSSSRRQQAREKIHEY